MLEFYERRVVLVCRGAAGFADNTGRSKMDAVAGLSGHQNGALRLGEQCGEPRTDGPPRCARIVRANVAARFDRRAERLVAGLAHSAGLNP
jgi:hypothetical protein